MEEVEKTEMAAADEYRCFVGGLSWGTTDRALEDAFRPYGTVLEAKVRSLSEVSQIISFVGLSIRYGGGATHLNSL